MVKILPENGYESPAPSPLPSPLSSPRGSEIFFGGARQTKKERPRHRLAYTGNGIEDPSEVESKEAQEDTMNEDSDANQQLEPDQKTPRAVGLRDRVGCYTWTWFTMTMATGGIANVLHSSRIPHIYPQSSGLTVFSSVPVRVATDNRGGGVLLQHCPVRHELHATHVEIPVEPWVIQKFFSEPV